jgi:hypothetical protein
VNRHGNCHGENRLAMFVHDLHQHQLLLFH